jgi:hypothetical protein
LARTVDVKLYFFEMTRDSKTTGYIEE